MGKLHLLLFFALLPIFSNAQWEQITVPRGSNNQDIAMVDGQLWLSTRNGLFVSPDEGLNWFPHDVFGIDSMVMGVETASDTIALVVSNNTRHTIHFRLGIGADWQQNSIDLLYNYVTILHVDKSKAILMSQNSFIYFRFATRTFEVHQIPIQWAGQHHYFLGKQNGYITFKDYTNNLNYEIRAISTDEHWPNIFTIATLPNANTLGIYTDGNHSVYISWSNSTSSLYYFPSTASQPTLITSNIDFREVNTIKRINADEYLLLSPYKSWVYNKLDLSVKELPLRGSMDVISLPLGGFLGVSETRVEYFANQSSATTTEKRMRGLYNGNGGNIYIQPESGELISHIGATTDIYHPSFDTIQTIHIGSDGYVVGGPRIRMHFLGGYGFIHLYDKLHRYESHTRSWRKYTMIGSWVNILDSMVIFKGTGSSYYTSTDFGETWHHKSNFIPEHLVSLSQGTWLGWNGGAAVQRSVDKGLTWTALGQFPTPVGTYTNFAAIQDTVFVEARNCLLKSTDHGETWQTLAFPTPLNAASTIASTCFSEKYFFACLNTNQENQILASPDHGKQWYVINGDLPKMDYISTMAYDSTNQILYISSASHGIWQLDIASLHLDDPMLQGSPFWRGFTYIDQNRNNLRDAHEPPATDICSYTTDHKFLAQTDQLGRLVFFGSSIDTDQFYHKPFDYTHLYDTIAPVLINKADIIDSFDVAVKLYDVALHGDIHDLCISATLLQLPRPGFTNKLSVEVRNLGTATEDGRVRVILPVEFELLSTSSTPVIQNVDSIVFVFINLAPNESEYIELDIRVSTTAQIGSQVSIGAHVEPFDDFNPLCNSTSERYQIVGSFDPNDKASNLNGYYHPDSLAARTPVDFTIRFENIGNYYAETVKVFDTIQPVFDLSTFRFKSSSHPCVVTLKDRNIVAFTFNNIFLDWQSPDNQGFVRFEIAPNTHLPIGTALTNQAEIFFDYNLPIVTNTVHDVIYPPPTSTVLNPSHSANTLLVWPNPTDQKLYVPLTNKQRPVRIEIFDIVGAKQNLATISTAPNGMEIDTRYLPSGSYKLLIHTTDQVFSTTFVVMR
jgi:Secretion system C-terminal sorting domain